MGDMITKVWNVEGLKRAIALIYWSIVTPSLNVIWPEGIPSNINKTYIIVGIALSALGLGHAAYKSYQAKGSTTTDAPADPTPPADKPAA